MAASALADAGFLVSLLSRGDRNHRWAEIQASRLSPPWGTCDAVLSEAFRLTDACLVRMTEALPDPVVLSTDTDFRVYRRHSRHAIPYVLPE